MLRPPASADLAAIDRVTDDAASVAVEAGLLASADSPRLPASAQQFQIADLQQWLDLCA
jgi:hypothetical protein